MELDPTEMTPAITSRAVTITLSKVRLFDHLKHLVHIHCATRQFIELQEQLEYFVDGHLLRRLTFIECRELLENSLRLGGNEVVSGTDLDKLARACAPELCRAFGHPPGKLDRHVLT